MRTKIDRGIFTIADVLTQDECQQYISWSESLGYETVSVSLAAGQVLRPDIRNNARVIVDSQERASDIWSRISADIPSIIDGRRSACASIGTALASASRRTPTDVIGGARARRAS